LQECIGISEFGERHLIIAVGGYDSNIHIYLYPRKPKRQEKSQFKYKVSLPGHFNAIRDFDFTKICLGNHVKYLASCS